MEITVAILIGLLTSIVVGQHDCKNFKMFDGNKEVPNVSCTLYTTKFCEHGPSTFPNNLSDGTNIAKPEQFDVKYFRRNFTTPNTVILASGATFLWQPPFDETSRKNIKGFYLKLHRVNSGKVICRLFDLQDVDLTKSTRFRFSYELFPFNAPHPQTYVVCLTSLPPPSDEDVKMLAEKSVIYIQEHFDYNKNTVIYPDAWTTWVTVTLHPSKGIIAVRFGFPTPDSKAKFTTFHAQLVNKKAPTKAQEERVIKRNGPETVGEYNFTNVPSGEYKIQVAFVDCGVYLLNILTVITVCVSRVYPEDLFFNNLKKCQCWKMTDNRRDCGTCSTSRTEYFNFTRRIQSRDPVTTTTTTTSDRVQPTEATTPKKEEPEGSLDTIVIVTAVAFPLVALILILVTLAYIYKKGKFLKPSGRNSSVGTKVWNQNMNNNRNAKPDQMAYHFTKCL